jgi:transcription antitermination factor NusG
MEDFGFVFGGYVVTFVSVAAYAWHVIRRARRVAGQVPDDEKPWL